MLIPMHTRECWWHSDREICLGCTEEPLVPPPAGTRTLARSHQRKGATLETSTHWNTHCIQTSYPEWNHACFCPTPMVSSCIDTWDNNHVLANHTLTQTAMASAFQLGQFSHRSWESLKACCMFGKVQLCRHSPIKNSTEQRALFKAELFTFVYL